MRRYRLNCQTGWAEAVKNWNGKKELKKKKKRM
jgi:hypothetical protein